MKEEKDRGRELHLGLIGAGRWGRRHLATLQSASGVRVAAVASSNPETASLAPSARLVKDWRDLLSTALDGVIVATPASTHTDILRALLQAHIPTLIEKPLCLTTRDAEALQQLAVSTRTPVMVDHTHLFHPAHEALKIKAVDLGPVRHIHSEGMAFGPFLRDVPVLWDWTPHDVYLCLDLMGRMPERVAGIQTDHTVALSLDFGSSCSASIVNSNHALEKRRRFAVHFDQHVLVFHDGAPHPLTLYETNYVPSSPQPPLPASVPLPVTSDLPLTRVVQYFINGLRGGDRSRFGLDLACRVVHVLETAQTAIHHGRAESVLA